MIIRQKKSKARIVAWVVIAAAWISLGVVTIKYFMSGKGSLGPVVNNPANALVTDGDTSLVDETPIEEDMLANYVVPADQPRYIYIPEIGVGKSRIIPLGVVASTGQLDAPVSIHDAGWYTGSAKPSRSGEGAVLIDGHNAGPTIGGVFQRLNQLSAGSRIEIELGSGEKFTYEIRDIREMLLDDINDPNNPLGMSTMLDSIEPGKQGLNMITCIGQWNSDAGTYNSRVMIRAVQV